MAFVTLGSATGGGGDPVQKVEIVTNYARAIAHETLRGHREDEEFAYCLFGEEEGREDSMGFRERVLVITAGLRPKQDPGLKTVDGRLFHFARWEACPAGTVMDLHSHPHINDFAFSEVDYALFSSASYKYHAISFPAQVAPGCDRAAEGCLVAKVVVYWFNNDGAEIRVIRRYAEIPWRGPPTAR